METTAVSPHVVPAVPGEATDTTTRDTTLGTTLKTQASLLDTPTTPPSVAPRPLLNVNIIDLLECDPRPTFVVALPTMPDSTASVVYCNPALMNSTLLQGIVTSPRSDHPAIWQGIPAAGDSHVGQLGAAVHLGLLWTRTAISGQRFVLISANESVCIASAAAPEHTKHTTEPEPLTIPQTLQASDEEDLISDDPTPSPLPLYVPLSASADSSSFSFPARRPPPVPLTTAKTMSSTETIIRLVPPSQPPEFLPSTQPQPPTPPTSANYSSLDDDDTSRESGGNAEENTEDDAESYLRQFASITAFMPVGMCVFDPRGNMLFANDAWCDITGCPPVPDGGILSHETFLSYVEEEDRPEVAHFYEDLEDFPSTTFGFRVKRFGGGHTSGHATSPSRAATPTPNPASQTDTLQTAQTTQTTHETQATRGTMETRTAQSPQQAGQSVEETQFAQFATRTQPASAGKPTPKRPSPPPIMRSTTATSLVTRHSLRDSHVMATAHAVRDARGHLVRILVCLRDVTEQRHIVEAASRHAQQINDLRRMAEFATVGMYDMDIDGRLRGANRVFFKMCGLEEAENANLSQEIIRPWKMCVAAEDVPILEASLERLIAQGEHQTAELRFKKPWISDDGGGNLIVAPRWIEATFLPVKDSTGDVRAITGCLTDVSLRKWQLDRERQVKEEAIESKRQQENFVDMTSHEIRNPLTVIMNCGDAVLESLHKIRDGHGYGHGHGIGDDDNNSSSNTNSNDAKLQRSLLDDSIDNAEIIVSSALHQKSIVDDILTLSKLDSDRLAVTPVISDPIDIVRSTLKMFDLQARQEKIQLHMTVDASFSALHSRLLSFDPSRVKQILINLLTNALKFTRVGTVREITVCIRTSRARPTDKTCAVAFVPRQDATFNTPFARDSPSVASKGEPVFLLFEVKDTGEGLTKEAMDTLFQKFVQVDSSTHVKHGGSGLGLFISKQLAEIQNGAIGVASQPGVGSTFAFYIEARVPPPMTESIALPLPQLPSLGSGSDFGYSPPKNNDDAGTDDTTSASSPSMDIVPSSPTTVDPTMATASPTTIPATTKPAAKLTMSIPERKLSSSSAVAMLGLASPSLVDVENVEKNSPTPTSPLTAKTTRSPVTTTEKQLASISPVPPVMRGVLIVDDNAVNQKVARRYFEKAGIEVFLASNGLEAQSMIRQSDRFVPGGFPISIVLMDMEMPVQDGLSCTRDIRSLEAQGVFSGGRIPIMMLTGNARPEQIAEALAAGCDDVVVKPFQMQQVIEQVQRLVHRLWDEDCRSVSTDTASQSTDDSP